MTRRFVRAVAEASVGFARDLWVYLVLATLLTTIMTTTAGVRQMSQVSSWFVGNLLVGLSIGASMTLGQGLTLRASYARAWPLAIRVVSTVVVFLGCVFAGVELALWFIDLFAPSLAQFFPRRSVLIVALPVSLVMMGLGFMKDHRERERQQHLRVERQLAETRLDALSARTDPHFLFNSLNSILALVEEDPRAAERAILELAAMFRYVLDGSRSQLVKLADELSFVESYLGLEQLRFGERMQVTVEIEAGLEDTLIPPLLLQPLVENAVRHGTSASRQPLQILLRAHRTAAAIELSVDDDGPGPDSSQHRGTGTSHANLRARLALVYGPNAAFETGRSKFGGFRALVRLPWVSA